VIEPIVGPFIEECGPTNSVDVIVIGGSQRWPAGSSPSRPQWPPVGRAVLVARFRSQGMLLTRRLRLRSASKPLRQKPAGRSFAEQDDEACYSLPTSIICGR
jgi:hypothetical protein